MVGQAHTSLVSGDRRLRRQTLWWLVALNVGFLLGSGAVMLTAWGLGALLGTPDMDEQTRLWLLLAVVVVFVVIDVPAALRGRFSLGFARQTPKTLQMRLRRTDITALVWGIDIGSGVSTYRMTSAIWLGLVGVFLGLVPFSFGWLYGFGVAVTVSLLVTWTGGGYALHANLQRLFAARRLARLAYPTCSPSHSWAWPRSQR